MRLRILLISLAVVTLATIAVNYSPFGGRETTFRARISLCWGFIARTNGNVVLDVRNKGSQQFEMQPWVQIEYLPVNPEDYVAGDSRGFTNDGFTLLPGSNLQVLLSGSKKRTKLAGAHRRYWAAADRLQGSA